MMILYCLSYKYTGIVLVHISHLTLLSDIVSHTSWEPGGNRHPTRTYSKYSTVINRAWKSWVHGDSTRGSERGVARGEVGTIGPGHIVTKLGSECRIRHRCSIPGADSRLTMHHNDIKPKTDPTLREVFLYTTVALRRYFGFDEPHSKWIPWPVCMLYIFSYSHMIHCKEDCLS